VVWGGWVGLGGGPAGGSVRGHFFLFLLVGVGGFGGCCGFGRGGVVRWGFLGVFGVGWLGGGGAGGVGVRGFAIFPMPDGCSAFLPFSRMRSAVFKLPSL